MILLYKVGELAVCFLGALYCASNEAAEVEQRHRAERGKKP